MPTQEERLTALEQKFATFQKQTADSIQEINENTTILLGVIRSQGRDIRRILEHMETVDSRLESIDTRLESIDSRLNTMDRRFDRLETRFNEHTALLTQILERLPKTL